MSVFNTCTVTTILPQQNVSKISLTYKFLPLDRVACCLLLLQMLLNIRIPNSCHPLQPGGFSVWAHLTNFQCFWQATLRNITKHPFRLPNTHVSCLCSI